MKYRQRTNRLSILLSLLLLGIASAASPWKMEEFPKPDFGLIADPDHLLSEQSLQELSKRIEDISEQVEVPIQIAVAVASKMHIPRPNSFYEDDQNTEDGRGMDEEVMAEEFARGLHDRYDIII